MAQTLSERFRIETRKDISSLLSNIEAKLELNLLLNAVRDTIGFENHLIMKFSVPRDGEEEILNKASEEQNNVSIFYRIISACFDPYLYLHITSEDKLIQKLSLKHNHHGKWRGLF